MKRDKNIMQIKQNRMASGEGFFLMEIVVGMLIIGLALVLYAASSNTVILNRTAKWRDIANQIASGKMDELRNSGFTSLPPSGSFSHASLGSLPGGSGFVTVTNINDNLKNVKVRVQWWDRGRGKQAELELETLIGKNGL